ncbi:MAG: hypothetical protein H6742_03255 [Alphaproteobacteria bacterium]|nr:hypothetical protein [Alphaproteobacteria bacterium]
MPQTPILCNSLRWKAFYGNSWRTREELAAALTLSDCPFSCLKTCQSWGPDGELVAPGHCSPDRGCFEVSDKDPSVGPAVS